MEEGVYETLTCSPSHLLLSTYPSHLILALPSSPARSRSGEVGSATCHHKKIQKITEAMICGGGSMKHSPALLLICCSLTYALAFALRSSPIPSRSPPCLYPLGPLFTRDLGIPFSPAPLHSLSALMRNHCIIVSKEKHKQCAQYKQAEHADKHGEGGCSPVRQTCSRDVECNFPDQKFLLGSLAKRYYSGWKY